MDMFTKDELWVGGLKGLSENYIKLLKRVDRPGVDDLIQFLASTDFFTAPASANGHNAYEGGLVEHSLRVYLILKSIQEIKIHEYQIPEESLILCPLLHDICKANFYVKGWRNVQDHNPATCNEKGWSLVPMWKIVDQCPLGHGEKSVILSMNFIKLTPHEQMAIRWHMGGFDDAARQYAGGLALTGASSRYPLITLLHAADLLSCIPEPLKDNQECETE